MQAPCPIYCTEVIALEPLQFSTIIGYILGLLVLFVVTRILLKPLKVFVRLLANSVVGVLLMMLINALPLGLYIGINPITALAAGILGVPGVCLLLVLQIFF